MVADSGKFAYRILGSGTYRRRRLAERSALNRGERTGEENDDEKNEQGGDATSDDDDVTYQFSAVLVDPPRCGLTPSVCDLLRRYDHIIYISCNPTALMRDLAMICVTGVDNRNGTPPPASHTRRERHWVERFAVFDHFPYTTGHLECGVYLRR